MKRPVLLAIGLATLASMASAAPLCISGGSMASYVALGIGGCEIGDKLFSNFNYGSTGSGTGVAVAATNVFLTPDNSDPSNPGIIFSSTGWVVPSSSPTTNSFVDSSIAFTVSVLSSAPIIEDGTLTLLGFTQSGTGIADIIETINPSGTGLQVDSGGPFVDHKFFTPVSSVAVLKDLFVGVPIGSTGSASITSFAENFSQVGVPEPVASMLIGSGLLGLALLRRRVRSR